MDETTPPLAVELPVTPICGRVGSVTIGLSSQRCTYAQELTDPMSECRKEADVCMRIDWITACKSST
jgi:hypothetical protein